jgi:pre-mRNA-processing factor 6
VYSFVNQTILLLPPRILLSRAVEVIPLSVEVWLSCAQQNLQSRPYLTRNWDCRWPTTSFPSKTLEQKAKELDQVDKTIEAAVPELRRHQVILTREQWLKEAERCESEGSVRTSEAIVQATVAMEIDGEDRYDTSLSDAESGRGKNSGNKESLDAIFEIARLFIVLKGRYCG